MLKQKNTLMGVFVLEERVGFEPTDARTSPVFKTGSFNHSDISPWSTCYIIPQHFCLSTLFYKNFFLFLLTKTSNHVIICIAVTEAVMFAPVAELADALDLGSVLYVILLLITVLAVFIDEG